MPASQSPKLIATLNFKGGVGKTTITSLSRPLLGVFFALPDVALQLLFTGVAVEKLQFSQNSRSLGDRKCLPKRRSSFVGLPIAKFFRPFSGE